jgi:periplasmic divalent cation tolerance protein
VSDGGGALIWCPFGDAASARDTAGRLLDEGLVACANILPGIESLYVWNGERGDTRECGVLFKTSASALDRAVARLAVLHPYDTPAILGWRCGAATPATLAWLNQATSGVL